MSEPTRGRILLVTSSFPRWSGDSSTPFVHHLAMDLNSLGWQVDVLAPHAPKARRSETLEGVGVERFRYWYPETAQTICYNGGALIQLRSNRTNILKLPALVGAELISCLTRLGRRYDLVNSHWLLPQSWTAGIASRLRHVPHVATVHGGDAFALRSPWMTAFKRWALHMSDAVTVNSSATRRVVDKLSPRSDVYQIPMGASTTEPDKTGVALRRRQLRVGNGPLICFVGRLIEEKGPGDLLTALVEIRRRRPDASVVVVGEGPYRAQLEEQARTTGMADHVHFTGWVDSAKVTEYLAAADVFVGPSKRSPDGWVEALGLTFIEAALAGTPIVATRTGGVEDVVRDAETGLLVEESDPTAIACAVDRLMDDPTSTMSMVNRARRHVDKHFTRQASAEAFSGLFETALRRSDRHRR